MEFWTRGCTAGGRGHAQKCMRCRPLVMELWTRNRAAGGLASNLSHHPPSLKVCLERHHTQRHHTQCSQRRCSKKNQRKNCLMEKGFPSNAPWPIFAVHGLPCVHLPASFLAACVLCTPALLFAAYVLRIPASLLPTFLHSRITLAVNVLFAPASLLAANVLCIPALFFATCVV